MAIDFYDAVNGDGLFDLLGKVFHAQQVVNDARGSDIPTALTAILTQAENFPDSLTFSAAMEPVPGIKGTAESNLSSAMTQLQRVAAAVIVQVVNADNPQANTQLTTALAEMLAQMKDQNETVDACTVSVSIADVGSPAGDGVFVLSKKRGDGLVAENIIAESLKIECTADGPNATLRVSSDASTTSKLDSAWPLASGTSSALVSIETTRSLLLNSDFDADTVYANQPDDWVLTVGTRGTTILMTTIEQQTIAIAGTPTGGYYLLHWTNAAGHTQTTAPIPYNGNGSTVQSALRALKGLEKVTVSSSGTSPDYTHTITFKGRGGNVGQLASTNRMTGATSVNEKQSIVITGKPDGGTFTLSITANGSTHTTAGIPYNAAIGTTEIAMENTSNLDDVAVTGSTFPNGTQVVEFRGSTAGVDLSAMAIDVSGLTKTAAAVSVTTTTPGSAGNGLPAAQAYWSFEDSSTTDFLDSVNGVDLPSFTGNPMTSVAGIQGNAIRIPTWDDYLQSSFVSQLQLAPSTDYTLACWVKLPAASNATHFTVYLQPQGGSNNYLYLDGISGSDFGVSISVHDNSGNSATKSSATTLSFGAWHLVIARLDFTNSTIGVSIDGGNFTTAAWTHNFSSVANWRISVTCPDLGIVDEIGLWASAFSNSDASNLWHSGAGWSYPYFGTDEIQSVSLTNDPTGGTFTLSWNNGSSTQTTAAIAYNATSGDVRDALVATSTIAPGDVITSGGPLPTTPVSVKFTGAYAGTNVNQMTGSGASLTQNAIVGTISTIQDGSPDSGSITHATTVPGTPQVYTGDKALILASNGSEMTCLHQRVTTLKASTPYGFCLWACHDGSSISAGVITIDLVDGISGTVLQDEQGTNASLSFNASGLTGSFKPLTELVAGGTECVFRTPAVLPDIVYLRVRISTAVTSAKKVFLDHLILTPLTELYRGGPWVACLGGADRFRIGDTFTLTTTNDRSGLLQEWFERNFGMSLLGLLLPSNSAGGETIPDSVVS